MSNFLARSQLLATVTITPTSKTVLSQAYTLYAVTRTPDASRHQVQGRLLSATFSQTRQVAATGEGTIPGVQARGSLTFYNDSTSPQSFAAGQIYTGQDGVKIMRSEE